MKKKQMYKCVLPTVLAVGVMLSIYGGGSALAAGEQTDSVEGTVMQLAKTEGDVGISNGSGKNISLIGNMKLHNGYCTKTQEASYAWINLDSEKLAKLDAVSEAEIRKSGKKLELLLESGNLFFNVTEELEEEETMNIRTSTMVMGIRGTSGWVKSIDRWHTQVYILEGTVQCSVTDPVTGQIKNITLTSGESADFYAYPQDQEGDKCDIITRKFTEDDIDGFALVELVQDIPLCEEIEKASGLDILSLADSAQQRLKDSEAEMRRIMAEIREKEASQDHHISKDPVWKKGNPAAGISGSGWMTPVIENTGIAGTGPSAGTGFQEEPVSAGEASSIQSSSSDSDRKPNRRPVPNPGDDTAKPDEDANEKAKQAYQEVLDMYREACKLNFSDYVSTYHNNVLSGSSTYISVYPNVSEKIMQEYYLGNISQIYYGYYDINGDGTDEMLMGIGSGTDAQVTAVYGYDTEAELVRNLHWITDYGYRSFFQIMKNGTIVQDGIPGVLYGYKMSEDGYQVNESGRYTEQIFEFKYANEVYLPEKVNQYKSENGLIEVEYDWNSLNVDDVISEKYVNPISMQSLEEALRDAVQRWQHGFGYTDAEGILHDISEDAVFDNLRILSDESKIVLTNVVNSSEELEAKCEISIPFVVDMNDPVIGICKDVTGSLSVATRSEMNQKIEIRCSELYQVRQPYRWGSGMGIYLYSSEEARYVYWYDLLPAYAGEYVNEATGVSLEFDVDTTYGSPSCTVWTPRPSDPSYMDEYDINSYDGNGNCSVWDWDRGKEMLCITPENGQLIIESTGADPSLDYLSGTYRRTD